MKNQIKSAIFAIIGMFLLVVSFAFASVLNSTSASVSNIDNNIFVGVAIYVIFILPCFLLSIFCFFKSFKSCKYFKK